MQVFLSDPNGKTHTLTVELMDTIQDLKQKIQAKCGVPARRQRLKTMCGKLLEDGCTTLDYSIQEHSTLQLSVAPCTRYNVPLEDTSAFARYAAKGVLENTTKIARRAARGRLGQSANDTMVHRFKSRMHSMKRLRPTVHC